MFLKPHPDTISHDNKFLATLSTPMTLEDYSKAFLCTSNAYVSNIIVNLKKCGDKTEVVQFDDQGTRTKICFPFFSGLLDRKI